VERAGGGTAAGKYTRHAAVLARLTRRAGAQAVQKEAANGLELVDELEEVFRK
jgi:hypothetical protein